MGRFLLKFTHPATPGRQEAELEAADVGNVTNTVQHQASTPRHRSVGDEDGIIESILLGTTLVLRFQAEALPVLGWAEFVDTPKVWLTSSAAGAEC